MLVIHYDTSEEIEPGESPFDDPALGFPDKAFYIVGAGGCLKSQACLFNSLGKSSPVSFVGHDLAQAFHKALNLIKQMNPFGAIMQVSCMNVALIKAAYHINHNLALTPIDLFVAIATPVFKDHWGQFDALRIGQAQARRTFTAVLKPFQQVERGIDLFKHPLLLPLVKVIVTQVAINNKRRKSSNSSKLK